MTNGKSNKPAANYWLNLTRVSMFFLVGCFLLADCHNKKTGTETSPALGTVELLCVNQFGTAVTGASVAINGASQESDQHGRCNFELPLVDSTEIVGIIAEKTGYLFLGPDSMQLVKGQGLKYVLNFFQGYHVAIDTRKSDQNGQSGYGGIEIYHNGTRIGSSDSSGDLHYYLFDETEGRQIFQARDQLNNKVNGEIKLARNDLDYNVTLLFKTEVPQVPLNQYRFIIRTVQVVNGTRNYLSDIDIYLNGNSIGKTDVNGRLNYILEAAGDAKLLFEAVWAAQNKKETWQSGLEQGRYTYFIEFAFASAASAPEVAQAWVYNPSYQPPKITGKLESYKIRIQNVNLLIPVLTSPKAKVGDFYQLLINELKAKKVSIPVTQLDSRGLEVDLKWHFGIVNKVDGKPRLIDPYLSFEENNIEPGAEVLVNGK